MFEYSRGARDPQITRSYKLDRLIATGGMGHVFAGRRRRDQRQVAIKILQPGDRNEARYREYMLHEVYALTVGANPRLVELLEFGETSAGTPYLVLQWLDGPNLGDVLAIESPVATRRALHLFAGLLDAVDLLHRRGVIHGDLKPDNLLLVRGPDGLEQVHLIDLGASLAGDSHVSLPHEVFGTPGYIAPEVVVGDTLTPQSDVYGAGVVLFELLTGARPFDGESLVEVVEQQTHGPIPRPSDHRPTGFEGLDAVVATALAPEPRRRFPDVAALRAAFLNAVDPQVGDVSQGVPGLPVGISAERPTSPYRRAVCGVR